jgi:hypothetical protein
LSENYIIIKLLPINGSEQMKSMEAGQKEIYAFFAIKEFCTIKIFAAPRNETHAPKQKFRVKTL